MSIAWKVLNIELSEGIPDLPLDAYYQGIFCVFWWHGIPLGSLEIPAAQLPIPATHLAHRVSQVIVPATGFHLLEQGFHDQLPTLFPKPDQSPELSDLLALQHPLKQLIDNWPEPPTCSVSVVICTRDRPEQLEQCLRSLQMLSHLPNEIIVVDNAPTSNVTKQVVEKFPAVQYILEPKPGLSVARNTGIDNSKGDIIAFTDDDVIVHANWVKQLQYGFQDPQVLAVTGLMLPAELETESQIIFQRRGGSSEWGFRALIFDTAFFEGMQYRGVPVWRIGAGANMAFRRKAFDLFGGFDERLGAGASGCSEDSEFWYRVLAEGWLCRYEPTAVVFHYHRKDLSSLQQQAYQYMRGHVAALLIQFNKYKHWGNLRRLSIALPRYYLKLVSQALFRGFRDRYSTLFAEILGCFSGIQFYLSTRKL